MMKQKYIFLEKALNLLSLTAALTAFLFLFKVVLSTYSLEGSRKNITKTQLVSISESDCEVRKKSKENAGYIKLNSFGHIICWNDFLKNDHEIVIKKRITDTIGLKLFWVYWFQTRYFTSVWKQLPIFC